MFNNTNDAQVVAELTIIYSSYFIRFPKVWPNWIRNENVDNRRKTKT